ATDPRPRTTHNQSLCFFSVPPCLCGEDGLPDREFSSPPAQPDVTVGVATRNTRRSPMRFGRWSVAVVVAFCGLFSLSARAQLTPPPSPDVVGVNDLLCIGVWDNRPTGGETLKTVRVDPQGNVSL